MRIDSSFFDLEKIAASGQCFRWECLGGNQYRIPAFGKVLDIAQTAPDALEARCTAEEWEQLWAPYFDMDTDYEAIVRSIDPQDGYLMAAGQAAQGIRILRQEPWETLVSFLISQNNNIPRIKTTIRRLCDAFGDFPTAEQIASGSPKTLSDCGLGYRAQYLWEAAVRFLRDGGSGPRGHGDYAQARMYFQSYNGIGEKVADCICLFGLGHKEAFPVDTWIKRILREQYAGSFPIQQYQPYAGVLQQYMFYYERARNKAPGGQMA